MKMKMKINMDLAVKVHFITLYAQMLTLAHTIVYLARGSVE